MVRVAGDIRAAGAVVVVPPNRATSRALNAATAELGADRFRERVPRILIDHHNPQAV